MVWVAVLLAKNILDDYLLLQNALGSVVQRSKGTLTVNSTKNCVDGAKFESMLCNQISSKSLGTFCSNTSEKVCTYQPNSFFPFAVRSNRGLFPRKKDGSFLHYVFFSYTAISSNVIELSNCIRFLPPAAADKSLVNWRKFRKIITITTAEMRKIAFVHEFDDYSTSFAFLFANGINTIL